MMQNGGATQDEEVAGEQHNNRTTISYNNGGTAATTIAMNGTSAGDTNGREKDEDGVTFRRNSKRSLGGITDVPMQELLSNGRVAIGVEEDNLSVSSTM